MLLRFLIKYWRLGYFLSTKLSFGFYLFHLLHFDNENPTKSGTFLDVNPIYFENFQSSQLLFKRKTKIYFGDTFFKKRSQIFIRKGKNRIKRKKNATAIRKSERQVLMILVKKITRF